jgi:membrane-bound metal-dependent hydrolase YbcI (DUF457 family)
MTFIFGHLIVTWLIGRSLEFLSKKKFNQFSWLLLLTGGLLPDFDFPIAWILGTDFHRTFTHGLIFVLVTFILGSLIFAVYNNKKSKNYAFLLSLGVLVHIVVDFFSTQGVPLLWPYDYYISILGISLGKPGVSMLSQNLAETLVSFKLAISDMALGTAWIFYLGVKKRIRF